MLPDSLVALSQQLLLAVKSGQSSQALEEALANRPVATLSQQLTTDQQRKAFWINVYNAYAVLLLKPDPGLLLKPFARHQHFAAKRLTVAETQLSLDDVEHGLLRHSRIKLSKGFLTDPFPSAFEKTHRVRAFDNRIHFALNCGGASCPPIRFYEPDRIDEQLDLATESFLETEVQFDERANILTVSRLLDWYRGDFGGKRGVVQFLKNRGLLPEGVHPSVRFATYDWAPELNAFA